MTETRQLAEQADITIAPTDKGLPDRAAGMTVDPFLATEPTLDEFWTPIVVLDDSAIRHNIDTMAAWCAERGLDLMPHGKTTMAPALWQRQLDAGSLGITLATMGQVRTARTFGLASIQLANAVVDERSLRYLAGELADEDFRFVCWADSLDTVDVMERTLREARPPRPVDVCVELGGHGGRTGARSVPEAIEIAERIARSDVLRLAGVGGYEGSLAHGGRSAHDVGLVSGFLASQVELHERITHLYDDGEIIVTAGGSTYFDLVADAYAAAGAGGSGATRPGGGRTRFVLRSGAYITHDDGFYHEVSPFDGVRSSDTEQRFVAGIHGIARVVSHPEPGLSLLDGGKRDLPFDISMPVPLQFASDLGGPWTPLEDAVVSAMDDQHSYLRLADDAAHGRELPGVGSVVRLGLSHPCTTFDKWRLLPAVESAESTRVVDLVRTYF